MPGKNKIDVKINGIEYTLISDEPIEYIQKIANYVDRKMNEISGVNARLSTAMTAVLAAVNIAGELHRQESGDEKLRDELLKYAEEYKNISIQMARYEIENESLKREIASLRNENNSLRHASQQHKPQQKSGQQYPQQQNQSPESGK